MDLPIDIDIAGFSERARFLIEATASAGAVAEAAGIDAR